MNELKEFDLQLFAETLGTQALTLSDMRKRSDFDGSLAFIVEALEHQNPIMDDCKWIEGNLPTGNRTTVRSSIPTPQIRLLNRGVSPSKSLTEQVQDTCIILEDRSEVDIEVLNLQRDPAGYRRSEDAAFVQGFSTSVAANMFYGDSTADVNTFNGLSMRYPTIGGVKGKPGYQVVSAGTANANNQNTSIYIVGFGTKDTVGLYPRNSMAGLKMRDLGENDATDRDGKKFRAVTSLFTWKCGLAVQNIRSNAILRNIDVTKLQTMTSDEKLDMINRLVYTKNRIQNLQKPQTQYSMYVSQAVYDFLETYLLDKRNVHVTRQDVQNAVPQLYFSGIPVKKCDELKETEQAFEEAPGAQIDTQEDKATKSKK